MKKNTYKIEGMHCSSCALMIESELEDIGIKSHCNYAKAELGVEYDEEAVDEDKIRQAVAKAGYTIVSR